MAKIPARELAKALLEAMEEQFMENTAMRVILEGCPDRRTRETWKSDVEKLLKNPENRRSVHSVFLPVYKKIEAVTDETDLISMLLKAPTKGKPH